MKYNWQSKNWPSFFSEAHYWESLSPEIRALQLAISEKIGKSKGLLTGLSTVEKDEMAIDLIVSEAVNSSEIEGEMITRSDVRSSIRNQLGFATPPERVSDKRATDMSKLVLTARKFYKDSLSVEMMFDWHRCLFASASYLSPITIGQWRTHVEPMQIVSGRIGNPKVHFEAPPSERVPLEMTQFIEWFNKSGQISPEIKAALAHLYFESIHPFEDGNGRLGRVIAEKALAQGWGYLPLLSLSQAIEADRNAYCDALNAAQTSHDFQGWILYFLNIVVAAQTQAEQQIEFIVKKTRFFDQFRDHLNERQLKLIQRVFDEGPKGFQGGISARKYMSLTGISKATATRDLHSLLELKAIQALPGSGRSTRYELVVEARSTSDLGLA